MPASFATLLIAFSLLGACSPALDWRDVSVSPGNLQSQFPCKPQNTQRKVMLAGMELPMTLLACDADGLTFGVLSATVADPARITDGLQAMRDSLSSPQTARSAAASASHPSAAVPGMTPHPLAARSSGPIRRPGGQDARVDSMVFTRGLSIHQATVMGPQDHRGISAAADAFFSALRFVP